MRDLNHVTCGYPRPVAHVSSREPPATLRTLDECRAWRLAEDQRLIREVVDLFMAAYELAHGDPVLH
jgi:hypothetical protein